MLLCERVSIAEYFPHEHSDAHCQRDRASQCPRDTCITFSLRQRSSFPTSCPFNRSGLSTSPWRVSAAVSRLRAASVRHTPATAPLVVGASRGETCASWKRKKAPFPQDGTYEKSRRWIGNHSNRRRIHSFDPFLVWRSGGDGRINWSWSLTVRRPFARFLKSA